MQYVPIEVLEEAIHTLAKYVPSNIREEVSKKLKKRMKLRLDMVKNKKKHI